MRVPVVLVLVVGLAPTAPAAQPSIDFATVRPHLGLLDAGQATHSLVTVTGWARIDGVWETRGYLFRFDEPSYHGFGFCAPVDLERGCAGQVDDWGQKEMLRIARPSGYALTRIWLSEVVGNDWVRIGVTDGPEPIAITWILTVKAGEGEFWNGEPCLPAVPVGEGPRNCDLVEAPVDVPPVDQQRPFYWVQGVPPSAGSLPGRHAFVLWGVDLEVR